MISLVQGLFCCVLFCVFCYIGFYPLTKELRCIYSLSFCDLLKFLLCLFINPKPKIAILFKWILSCILIDLHSNTSYTALYHVL